MQRLFQCLIASTLVLGVSACEGEADKPAKTAKKDDAKGDAKKDDAKKADAEKDDAKADDAKADDAKADDDAATDDAAPSDDDSGYWKCLKDGSESEDTCESAGCIWCNSKAGFGICLDEGDSTSLPY